MKGRLTHNGTGLIFELEPRSILGRSPTSTVEIPDGRVSRRHAMICEYPDGFWYHDLGSFNGSSLNGMRVTGARKLTTGDQIEIGNQVFTFEQDGSPADSIESFVDASTLAHVKSGDCLLLVSDIQGYTTLSEHLSPDQLAPIIGSWYSRTEEILFNHGAILDKFIGDCVLAYWTDTSVSARIRAFQTAGAMQQSCIDTYEEHRPLLESLGLGFGKGTALHIGRVAFGGLSAQEFSLVGDAVNLAYRMESLTRTVGYPVVTSAQLVRDWPEGAQYCKWLGSHEVKGRSAKVDLYALERVPVMG